ncbi:MAG TPA: SH3 domain-containing protein [Kofleriaceae bacterium]|nr:SH3 domain-containing protein [Kofleriaceae bacterium]
MRGATATLLSTTLSLLLGGCVAGDVEVVEDDPIVEPPLSDEEVDDLPPGEDDPEHTDELVGDGAADAPDVDDSDGYQDEEVPAVPDDLVPHAALIKYGLHPRASDGLIAVGVPAWRITQTIGNAAASAGYHAQDGTVNGQPYTAAVDISVSGLSSTQIHNMVDGLGRVGFAAWYRLSGSDGWVGANHIHAVYANCRMKEQLRSQVRSWLVGRNGLVSNTIYQWHAFSQEAKQAVQGKFGLSQQGTINDGAGASGRVNTDGTGLNVRSGPGTQYPVTAAIPDGDYVSITCQVHGGELTGTFGTTTLWDQVGGGYVSDAYVSTGSDGQIAPTCQ